MLSNPEISDMTLPVTPKNLAMRLCVGTLRDIYNASELGAGERRSLNGIAFPNPFAAVVETPEASDFRALRRCTNLPGGSSTVSTDSVRFGLAATEGAFHYVHFDPRGNGTTIRVSCGLKWWIVLRFRDPNHNWSTEFWSDGKFDIRKIDLSLFIVELVVLCPRDKL